MNWTLLYGICAMASGLVCAGLAMYLAPFRLHTAPRRLMLLMWAAAVWNLGYGLEFLHPDLGMRLFWCGVEYAGTVWIGMLVLQFIFSVTGRSTWLTPRNTLLLSLLPLLFLVLVYTNQFHGLMWQQARLDTAAGIWVVIYDRGPAFWAYVAYTYGLILWGTGLLIRTYLQSNDLFRKQITAILWGIAPPWICNILYLFVFPDLKNLDITPFAFMLTGAAFAWGLVRYQLLNLIPLAHAAVMESMGDPVIVLDMEDRVVAVNKACATAFDVREFIPGRQTAARLFPGLSPIIAQHRGHRPVTTEAILDGSSRAWHWHLSVSPLLTRRHRQKGWLIVLRDITEQKNAEAGLRENEEQQRTMLEASPLPIAYYTEEGDATYVNPAFTRTFGWQPHELTGCGKGFIPCDLRKETLKAVADLFDGSKKSIDMISRRRTRSGEILDVSLNAALYQGREGIYNRVVVTYTDITHIKQVETELRQARDYVHSIINSMPSVIIGVDSRVRVTQWNLEAEKMTGIPARQARDRHLEAVFPEMQPILPDIYQALETLQIRKREKTPMTMGDRASTTDIFIYPILSGTDPGAVIRVDDISERIKIEEMMVHSEKMMSVGGLAAGMAHEINNPLAGILQNIQVIRNRLSRPLPANERAAKELGLDLERVTAYMTQREIFKLMEQATSAGQRAAKIVANMLSFSRKTDSRRSSHCIMDMMDSCLDLVRNDYTLKKRHDILSVEIAIHKETPPPLAPCERSKIQQVFFNIIKNGVEAMSEAGTAAPKFDIRYFTEPGFAGVEIRDNGPGMPADTRKRIFEPFFTTKPVGVGTGLGLSVSYFIIKENHGGDLSVTSQPGRGTAFTVKLPVS